MPAPTLVVGAPCWIDLYSSDTAKATDFYGRVLGWVAEPPGRASAATSRSRRTASTSPAAWATTASRACPTPGRCI